MSMQVLWASRDDLQCACEEQLLEDFPKSSVKKERSNETVLEQLEMESTKRSNCYYTRISFGVVPLWKTVTKSVHIQNDSEVVTLYEVQRDSYLDKIYQVLDCSLLSKDTPVNPQGTIECKLTYRPILPNRKSFEKFLIVDSSGNLHIIYADGESTGPRVSISVKYLNFFILKNLTKTKAVVEIRNSHAGETFYQFDVDKTEANIFQIGDKKQGTLKPNSVERVSIRFSPKNVGVYSKRLWCLFLNHEPILIKLFGIFQRDRKYNMDSLKLKRTPYSLKCDLGIHAYLRINIKCQKTHWLTKPYLFFHSPSTLPTILKNDSNFGIKIQWFDENETFSIYPRTCTIPAQDSFVFECIFKTKEENKVYYRKFHADVQSVQEETISETNSNEIIIPENMEIRLVGHTFTKPCPWIFEVEVEPETLVLPPCLPGSYSFGTFLIKVESKLPVLFRLIKPNKHSLFSMKPMVGLIRKCQVITVFFTTQSSLSNFTEKWQLITNESERSSTYITLTAQSCLSSLIVGDNNEIKFPCTQAGATVCTLVAVRNASNFQLSYEFLIGNNQSYIKVTEKRGIIRPNEELFVHIYFTGKLCLPKMTQIICQYYVVEKYGELIGIPLETKINVYTPCEYSQICATPKTHDLGEIEWNSSHETRFELYNFGKSPVPYQLKVTNNLLSNLSLSNNEGIIQPEEHFLLIVKLKVKDTGDGIVKISYLSQNNEQKENVALCTIKYQCINPTFQIKDIITHNFGKLFDKSSLWKLLDIDSLNRTLQSNKFNKVEEIFFHLPDFTNQNETFYLKFLLENVTNFKLKVSFKRIKKCECEPIEIKKSLTLRKKVYQCPHRKMFTMDLSTEEILPGNNAILTLAVRYTEPNQNSLFYNLLLNERRVISITALVNPITDEVLTLSSYDIYNEMKFQDVFIGEPNPPLQMFWVYNNSSNIVAYNLDVSEMIRFCNEEQYPILECLNPIDNVQPYQATPIIFRFHPIEIKSYKLCLPLLLGDKVVPLKLTGKGSQEKISNIQEFVDLISKEFCKMYAIVSLYFFPSSLIIDNLPVWKLTERVIFIKNDTKDTTYSFQFEDNVIEGVVFISTNIKEGFIEPKASQAILIKITSFGESSIFHTRLPCRFLNHSNLLDHEDTVRRFQERKEKLAMMTELDEIDMEEIEITPKPIHFYLTLELYVQIVGSVIDNIQELQTQYKNCPQESMSLNITNVLDRYENYLVKIEHPVRGSACTPLAWLMRDHKTETDKKVESDFQKIDQNDREFLSEIITGLIAEVIFSNKFADIVESERNRPSDYYSQYKPNYKKIMSGNKAFKQSKVEHLKKQAGTYLSTPKIDDFIDTMKFLIQDGLEIATLPEDLQKTKHNVP